MAVLTLEFCVLYAMISHKHLVLDYFVSLLNDHHLNMINKMSSSIKHLLISIYLLILENIVLNVFDVKMVLMVFLEKNSTRQTSEYPSINFFSYK